jgi:hypothetical protein
VVDSTEASGGGFDKSSKKETPYDVRLVHDKTPHLPCKVLEGLPQPPFLLTVVAPRRSGKTNLLLDLLLDEEKYCYKFDAIFIWSKTFNLDYKWRNITLPPGSVFNDFKEEECMAILDAAEQVNAIAKPPVNILFIFDDMVGEGIMNPHKLGTLDKIAVRGRHMKVSIIILTQQYMALSPPVRNNTTNQVIFRVRNRKEFETIAIENCEHLTVNKFKKMFMEATSERFSFLHINNQEEDPANRFHKKWRGVIGNGAKGKATRSEAEKEEQPEEEVPSADVAERESGTEDQDD